MSEWIESHAALRDHPKLKRLSRRLSISRREATGLLHWLWWWAMDYAPDGDLSGFSDEDVADGVDWEGDAQEFMDALRESGFIDGSVLHDWDQYGGKLHLRRKANAERMRAARSQENKTTPEADAQHVQRTCGTREGLEERRGEESTGEDRTDRTEEGPAAPVENSPKEVETLKRLRSVPGYPLDEARDLELLREPRDPRIDTAAEVQKWREYWEPKWKAWRKKDPPNYRLSWRNWLEQAERIVRERNGPLPPPRPVFTSPIGLDPDDPEVPMPDFVKEAIAGIGRGMP